MAVTESRRQGSRDFMGSQVACLNAHLEIVLLKMIPKCRGCDIRVAHVPRTKKPHPPGCGSGSVLYLSSTEFFSGNGGGAATRENWGLMDGVAL